MSKNDQKEKKIHKPQYCQGKQKNHVKEKYVKEIKESCKRKYLSRKKDSITLK